MEKSLADESHFEFSMLADISFKLMTDRTWEMLR